MTVSDTDDFEIVRKALKRLLNIALSHRYGGYGDAEKQAREALEALERIERPRLL